EEGDRFEAVQFSTIGRRGRDFARKRGIETRKDYAAFFGRLRYAMAKEVADDLIVEFRERKLDAVYVLYNQFKSAITQAITFVQHHGVDGDRLRRRGDEIRKPYGCRRDERNVKGGQGRPGDRTGGRRRVSGRFAPRDLHGLDAVEPEHLRQAGQPDHRGRPA